MFPIGTWIVWMKGRLGYSCMVPVGDVNARDEKEAVSIAEALFPELKAVSVQRVVPG